MRRLACLLAVASLAGADGAAFAERVNAAIDRGVAWLKAKQRPDGSFGRIGGEAYVGAVKPYDYPAGPTALALQTLLKCGTPPGDPAVVMGFQHLLRNHAKPGSTYEVAIVMLALEAKANPVKRERLQPVGEAKGQRPLALSPEDRRWMQALLDQLVKSHRGHGWRYFDAEAGDPHGIHLDLSNTHYAVMALHAAQRAGLKVPAAVVTGTADWVLSQQEKDGPKRERFDPDAGKPGRSVSTVQDRARGWAYAKDSPTAAEAMATGSMTAAGIIILEMCADIAAALDPAWLARRRAALERAIADGLAWLDLNWAVDRNPPGYNPYGVFYLYGVERVRDLRRRTLIGAHDRYTEGATYLLESQGDDGRWDQSDIHPPRDVLNTCFALLFLDRATLSVTTPRR